MFNLFENKKAKKENLISLKQFLKQSEIEALIKATQSINVTNNKAIKLQIEETEALIKVVIIQVTKPAYLFYLGLQYEAFKRINSL